MHAIRQPRPLGFNRALRLVTAFVTMTQLVIVAAAPLGERASSDVAAVHVEPGGTSTHHAHDDLCATCVALHLLWTPPRGSVAVITGPTHTRPPLGQREGHGLVDLLVLLPRAPPA
ncbi:MAG: hypothetical protein ACT4PJ_00500 [Gemmatimonadaceae bacterium]